MSALILIIVHIIGCVNEESKEIYSQSVSLVEKCYGFCAFLFIKLMLPAMTLPPFIVSFFKYYTIDLGKEAFQLPIALWLVQMVSIIRPMQMDFVTKAKKCINAVLYE